VVGTALAEAPTPAGTRIAAVLRGSSVVMPDGATVLEAGDRLLAVTGPDVDLGALTRWAGCRDGHAPAADG
jgi:cell volume regulation protein A